jgi:hypothetical protein
VQHEGKFLIVVVQPQALELGAAERQSAGAGEPCSGERPVWWPEEEEGKKRRARGGEGIGLMASARRLFGDGRVWDG